MLKTEYFTSDCTTLFSSPNINGQHSAIEDARKKRNEFISSNSDLISEIHNEKLDLVIIPAASGFNPPAIIATITLSYYLKEKQ